MLFVFLTRIKVIRRKSFLPVKSSTNFALAVFHSESDFRRKLELNEENFKFRILFCYNVIRPKNLSRGSRHRPKLMIFLAWWAASNGIWTNFLLVVSEIIGKYYLKNVTELRLNKPRRSLPTLYYISDDKYTKKWKVFC